MEPLLVATILGTRPEAVKMAPVIRALRAHPATHPLVVSTGQHREMLAQILGPFGIVPEVDLGIMRPSQSLNDITVATLRGLEPFLAARRPDMVLVQGDTTTAFAATLAAFHARLPVGHVEAGLRTHDLGRPYPEEGNRRLVSALAALHFAPTEGSAANLRREGVAPERILVTGNTVIDCLLDALRLDTGALAPLVPPAVLDGRRTILVTAHRRENWDGALGELCLALQDTVREFPDVAVLFPVHLNPAVRQVVAPVLGSTDRVALVDPLPYFAFVEAMNRAHLIVTDSGGVQEEAPTLGRPVLVVRDTTERPEAVQVGAARLVGGRRDGIAGAIRRLLQDPVEYRAMATRRNPYGDGRAAERVAQGVADFFGRQPAVAVTHPDHEERDLYVHGIATS
jgi:UDP-N-acetylglucosamine 2-epimerase (non-hydrolysing)